MNNINPAAPSLKSLITASVLATLLAVTILVAAVLPAEYGIDPTGLGKMMGLTALSAETNAMSQPLAVTCEPLSSSVTASGQDQKPAASLWQDSVKILVPAGKGLEYKFHMIKGATLEYSWATDGATLYFDFHGEPQGDNTGYFKSFKESTDHHSTGTLTAPFEGSHDWYWENKSRSDVTIILHTKGVYRVLGLM